MDNLNTKEIEKNVHEDWDSSSSDEDTTDSDSDQTYTLTKEDLRTEKRDLSLDGQLVDDDGGVSARKRRGAPQTAPSAKRTRNKTNRFGSVTKANHNAFFENIVLTPQNSNLNHTQETTNCTMTAQAAEKSTSQSDQSIQLLHTVLRKIGVIEDFLIELKIKMDIQCRSRRQLSDENESTEIDIGDLKSLGLPAESESDINKLEQNLKNDDFRKKLMAIMGALNDGKSTGNAILERLTQYLISPKYLPHVSWTGRGKEKERKFALSACDQLVNFIVVTVNKFDKNFNRDKVLHEMKYGILKRAPSKFGKAKGSKQNASSTSSSEESSSASPTLPIDIPIPNGFVNNNVANEHVQNSKSALCDNSYESAQSANAPSELLATISHSASHTPISQKPSFTPISYYPNWDIRFPPYGIYPPPPPPSMHRL